VGLGHGAAAGGTGLSPSSGLPIPAFRPARAGRAGGGCGRGVPLKARFWLRFGWLRSQEQAGVAGRGPSRGTLAVRGSEFGAVSGPTTFTGERSTTSWKRMRSRWLTAVCTSATCWGWLRPAAGPHHHADDRRFTSQLIEKFSDLGLLTQCHVSLVSRGWIRGGPPGAWTSSSRLRRNQIQGSAG